MAKDKEAQKHQGERETQTSLKKNCRRPVQTIVLSDHLIDPIVKETKAWIEGMPLSMIS
jgi:hypothetical protein